MAYTNMTISGTPNAGARNANYTAPRTLGLGLQANF
jgi:hypothetical protein